MRRALAAMVLAGGVAHAAPTIASPGSAGARSTPAGSAESIDSVVCQRTADHTYLSVQATPAPSVTLDRDQVKVCTDDAKKTCKTFTATWDYGSSEPPAANRDGTLVVVPGSNGEHGPEGIQIHDVATGKVKRTLWNKQDRIFSCGGGVWLGDVVLAFGFDCQEYDAEPFLANGTTGKFIAPLVDKKFATDRNTVYEVAQLDRKRWAIAAFNAGYGSQPVPAVLNHAVGLGTVFVIDVTTGKVLATAQGATDGSAVVTEGKATRTLAKLPACKP